MSYTPLYNTERPQRFDEVIGHDVLIRIIQNAWKQNRLFPNFLFTSNKNLPGIGKTTLARLIAKLWNCDNVQNAEPCNTCDQCKAIINDTHPDVYEIDGASHSGVANIRELVKRVDFGAQFGQHIIIILDEVHMLSKAAFNALLKPIEEHDADIKFIFATTELDKVLSTVVSRSQHFELKPIPSNIIVTYVQDVLEKYEIQYEQDALGLLQESFHGSVRDALMQVEKLMNYNEIITIDIVQDILGILPQQRLFAITDALESQQRQSVIQQLHSLYADGFETVQIIQSLHTHIRKLFQAGLQINFINDNQYKSKIHEYTLHDIKSVFAVFQKWLSLITQVGKPWFYIEEFGRDLYEAWVVDGYESHIQSVVQRFQGKIVDQKKQKVTIKTAQGNVFDIVSYEKNVENEYYCLYPDDVLFILRHNEMNGQDFLHRKVIKKK